ncbi:hypothetical protein BDY24DRAFT_164264 [Mrakia frigida]|uniref:NYN domain-containing protein n=1 Tax=Mrakia frigida TaxID=29902 RepID=UPI003FCC1C74
MASSDPSSSFAQGSLVGQSRYEELLEMRVRQLERELEQERRPGNSSLTSSFLEQKVAIFWDWENCTPPHIIDGSALISELKRLVRPLGVLEPIQAYLDIQAQPPSAARLRGSLGSLGVRLLDCPRLGRKEVADHAIVRDINSFARRFPVDGRSRSTPHTVVLISGDNDFSQLLHQLSDQGFNVVLIENPIGASQEMKSSASIVHQWKEIVRIATKPTTRPLPPSVPPPPPSTQPRAAPAPNHGSKFGPLVATLEGHLRVHPTNPRPRRALIAPALLAHFPNAYDVLLGEKSWKAYAALAEKEGVVELGSPGSGFEWIRLKEEPSTMGVALDRFLPLVQLLERHASRPLDHSYVKRDLTSTDFRRAGQASWEGYLRAAIAADVVVVGVNSYGVDWIALRTSVGTQPTLPPYPTSGFASTTQARQLVEVVLSVPSTSPIQSRINDILLVRHPRFRSVVGFSTWSQLFEKAQESGIVKGGMSGSSPIMTLVKAHPLVVNVVAGRVPASTQAGFASSVQARQLVEAILAFPSDPLPHQSEVNDLLLKRHPRFRLVAGFSTWVELARKAQENGIVKLSTRGASSSVIALVQDHPLVRSVTAEMDLPSPTPRVDLATSESSSILIPTATVSAPNPPSTPTFISSLQARQLVEVLLDLHPKPLQSQVQALLFGEWTNEFPSWMELTRRAEENGLVEVGYSTSSPTISLVHNHPLVVGVSARRAMDASRSLFSSSIPPKSLQPIPRSPSASSTPLILSLTPHQQRIFLPLIKTLRANPLLRPLRAKVAFDLKNGFSKVYSDAGVSGWMGYSELASRAGVVELGVGAVLGSEWVSLREKHRAVPPLSTATTGRNGTPSTSSVPQTRNVVHGGGNTIVRSDPALGQQLNLSPDASSDFPITPTITTPSSFLPSTPQLDQTSPSSDRAVEDLGSWSAQVPGAFVVEGNIGPSSDPPLRPSTSTLVTSSSDAGQTSPPVVSDHLSPSLNGFESGDPLSSARIVEDDGTTSEALLDLLSRRPFLRSSTVEINTPVVDHLPSSTSSFVVERTQVASEPGRGGFFSRIFGSRTNSSSSSGRGD